MANELHGTAKLLIEHESGLKRKKAVHNADGSLSYRRHTGVAVRRAKRGDGRVLRGDVRESGRATMKRWIRFLGWLWYPTSWMRRGYWDWDATKACWENGVKELRKKEPQS